jgi:hypothetical protein
MLPNTPDRVPSHTSAAVNRRIQQESAESVRWHARHPERIDQRLRDLDAEWDIERTLEANAATIALRIRGELTATVSRSATDAVESHGTRLISP